MQSSLIGETVQRAMTPVQVMGIARSIIMPQGEFYRDREQLLTTGCNQGASEGI